MPGLRRLIRARRPLPGALLCCATVLALFPPSAAADAVYRSSIGVLKVGHWVDVSGTLGDDGSFSGEKAELLQPEPFGILVGTVAASERDPRRFQLLGRTVTTDAQTRWRNVAPAALAGARVKVEGVVARDGSVRAATIAPRGAGRDHVGGRVDDLRATDAGPVAKIFGFDVRLPGEVEHDEALDALAEAPPSGSVGGYAARDEDDQFGDGVALGSTVRLTGQLELDGDTEREFDLDATEDLDRDRAAASARLRLDWQPLGGRVSGAVEGRAAYSHSEFASGESLSVDEVVLGEAYLDVSGLGGKEAELVVGRQDFDDAREWIYDQNLDGLRFLWGGRRVQLELSANTTVSGGSPRDRAATNFVALLGNRDRRRRLVAWVMHRDFDLAVPERTTHLGVRATGKWIPGTDGWLDAAVLRGRRGAVDLEGWGFDAGVTAKPNWLEPLSFTLGYAWGSGGTIDGETDRTFRQTGFQDNNAKFAGVTSFRYYGELFDPELANLRVVTAGVGVRFARKSSLDLVWHLYEQDTPRKRLLDTSLDRRAEGANGELGWEGDLVFGSRELAWLDLEAVAAYFDPGKAFAPDAKAAFLGKLQVRFRF